MTNPYLSAFVGCFRLLGIGIDRMFYRHLPDVFDWRRRSGWLSQAKTLSSRLGLQSQLQSISVKQS